VGRAQREALEVPEARVRRDLQDGHGRERGEREPRDLPPGAEDVDDAREHEVERHARDAEPEHVAPQATRPLLLLLAALDLARRVGVALDGPLDPVAERLGTHLAHARSLPQERVSAHHPPA